MSTLNHSLDQPVSHSGRVLVVDDEKNIRTTLEMVLTGGDYVVDLASECESAELCLQDTTYDVVLLDVRMPGKSGLECLKLWKEQWPDTVYILMSGEASLSEALDGLKLGAFDFIEKPILSARLLTCVKHAADRAFAKRRIDLGQGESIVGQSPAVKKVLSDADKIARTKARVLICGESGTGKDLLARYIHLHSARSDRPFIKINCASIPADLVESELFGHTKGAFTGAVQARSGHFQSAHGGTLFLDEIGELPLAAQAKMLRALQSGEVTPVGSSQVNVVDVRVIAATNRDLKAEVARGNFREDLYYRIAVVTLESPSLRSRGDDVLKLANYFITHLSEEYGVRPKTLNPAAERALANYNWPGNIREMRNVMERCVILGGSVLTLSELPPEIAAAAMDEHSAKDYVDQKSDVHPTKDIEPWHEFKSRSEKAHILKAIQAADGSMSEAARLLQVERQTIYKWLKVYGIERE